MNFEVASIWTYQLGGDYWWDIVIKGFVLAFVLITAAAYSVWAERKVAARIQLRIGPNRVGKFGLLQPLADAVKLLMKESSAPSARDRILFAVAPVVAVTAAFFAFAVIPVSSVNNINGFQYHWDIAHINVGLLFVFAVTSLGVYALFLGGWSGNSKYSLLGGLRSSAQLISYEMAVSFAVLGVIILAGSLNLETIVTAQKHLWFIFLQPLAFLLYFTGALAETNRLPFDLPEAETELVAGYHTEYTSMQFGVYFLAEYINMVTVSSIATVLFLGGWQSPTGYLSFVPGVIWFLIKVVGGVLTMMWIRWTLPRFRYDRLMNFGWKALLPLGLLNIVITGGVVGLRG